MKITTSTEKSSFCGPTDISYELFKEESFLMDTGVITAWEKFEMKKLVPQGNRHERRSLGHKLKRILD